MANEKKMIVTDLDGTLLKNDKTISKNTIEAINELRMLSLIHISEPTRRS